MFMEFVATVWEFALGLFQPLTLMFFIGWALQNGWEVSFARWIQAVIPGFKKWQPAVLIAIAIGIAQALGLDVFEAFSVIDVDAELGVSLTGLLTWVYTAYRHEKAKGRIPQ